MSESVYILLGSNLGDRESFLVAARHELGRVEGLEIVASSALYISEAQDMVGENPSFLNQVIKTDYLYTPGELLHTLEAIERKLGRTSKGDRQPRTIDLDILLFSDHVVESGHLIIPHPELLKRAFAMVPLLEIDPLIVHPVTGSPIRDSLPVDAGSLVMDYKDHVTRNV